jgi:hypothetical protein
VHARLGSARQHLADGLYGESLLLDARLQPGKVVAESEVDDPSACSAPARMLSRSERFPRSGIPPPHVALPSLVMRRISHHSTGLMG